MRRGHPRSAVRRDAIVVQCPEGVESVLQFLLRADRAGRGEVRGVGGVGRSRDMAGARVKRFEFAPITHRRAGVEEHAGEVRSEEHTSELQSRFDLVCRLLLEKKKNIRVISSYAY